MTFGEKYMQVTIRKENGDKCSFIISFFRSILTILIGWLSWMNIPGSAEKLSFIDIISGTRTFYIPGAKISKSDTEERRMTFLKIFPVILPILTIVFYLFIMLAMTVLKTHIYSADSIYAYIAYLIIPMAFFTTFAGLIISIQCAKERLYPVRITKLFTILNAALFIVYLVFVIKTLFAM